MAEYIKSLPEVPAPVEGDDAKLFPPLPTKPASIAELEGQEATTGETAEQPQAQETEPAPEEVVDEVVFSHVRPSLAVGVVAPPKQPKDVVIPTQFPTREQLASDKSLDYIDDILTLIGCVWWKRRSRRPGSFYAFWRTADTKPIAINVVKNAADAAGLSERDRQYIIGTSQAKTVDEFKAIHVKLTKAEYDANPKLYTTPKHLIDWSSSSDPKPASATTHDVPGNPVYKKIRKACQAAKSLVIQIVPTGMPLGGGGISNLV